MGFFEKFISKRFYPNLILIQVAMDLILLNGSYFLAIFIRWGSLEKINIPQVGELSLVINLSWVLILLWLHVIKPVRMERISSYLFRLSNILVYHVFLIVLIIFLFKFSSVSRLQIFYFYLIFSFFLVLIRLAILFTLKKLRKKGYNFRTIAFVGWDNYANNFFDIIKYDLSSGYKILGYYNNQEINNMPLKYIGDFNLLKHRLSNDNINELLITTQSFSKEQIKELIQVSDANMTRLRFIPHVINYGLSNNFEVIRYGQLPAFAIRKEPLEKLVNRILKRIFDFVFALLVVLLIFTWLFPIIAILVKLNSRGPVFFRQLRSGRNNYTFYCLKFRTMRVNTDSDKLQATRGDSRITKIGRFLRKTSIDELPQFFNVLIGSMSVVGPRPHMIKHTEQYSNDIDNFMVRHYLKPGITGWAQVNGFRGETKKLEDMERRVQHDLFYLENWNVLLDIKIILLTVINIFRGESKAY
jgi:putative colanic acid biosynthesis UDP-glucose lipid carrier transferase